MNYTESIQGGLVQELICYDKYVKLQGFKVCIKTIYGA